MATSFVVLGEPEDRSAFIDTIRAFALANRIGDRLTISGYGKHRRRLQNWVSALRIEHAVVFDDPIAADPPAFSAHDVAIILFRRPERTGASLQALLAGLRVVAFDRDPTVAMLFADGELGSLVPVGDRIALTYGLLGAPQPARADVLQRLAPYLARGLPLDHD